MPRFRRIIDQESAGLQQRSSCLCSTPQRGRTPSIRRVNSKKPQDITGIVLTKLDGTAKGGVVLAIHRDLGLPVKFIGVGEQVDDLQPFDAEDFARALFERRPEA